MYVDNTFSGVKEDKNALELKHEMSELMAKGGFNLTKWALNSSIVMENIPPKERAANLVISHTDNNPEKISNSLKALGIAWNTKDDIFLFQDGRALLEQQDPFTKRSLISLFSGLFDPMGLVSPFLMRPKLLFQELWAPSKDWDERLDDETAEKWRTWKCELEHLDQIRVKRCLLPQYSVVKKIEVHGFGDASPRAYGSSIYMCVEDERGARVSNLVMAKFRVAPLKRVTLLLPISLPSY